MKVLSIDCGIVSMSYSLFDVVDGAITPLRVECHDISKGESFSNVTSRIKFTVTYATEVLMPLIDEETVVLIEKQIPSFKSYDLMIVLYTTILLNGNVVKLVDPNLKNKYVVDVTLAEFSAKYMNKYAANKAFSKYNYKKLLEYMDTARLYKNYPNKYEKDVADSFMQAVSYIQNNN